jgi:hypothetical protein
MSLFSGKCSPLVTVLCLSWSAAHAQNEPVKYWVPFGPFGYGGAAEAASAETYGSFPGFDAGQAGKSGFSFRSTSAPVSALTSGLGWSGIGRAAAFGNFGALSQESTQLDYNFKGAGGLPVTVFGGVDTLKYNPDVFNAVTSFNTNTGNVPATSVHAGVEIRPTSNLSLSFSAGYTQQQFGPADSDIRSTLLPGESPMFAGGRR